VFVGLYQIHPGTAPPFATPFSRAGLRHPAGRPCPHTFAPIAMFRRNLLSHNGFPPRRPGPRRARSRLSQQLGPPGVAEGGHRAVSGPVFGGHGSSIRYPLPAKELRMATSPGGAKKRRAGGHARTGRNALPVGPLCLLAGAFPYLRRGGPPPPPSPAAPAARRRPPAPAPPPPPRAT